MEYVCVCACVCVCVCVCVFPHEYNQRGQSLAQCFTIIVASCFLLSHSNLFSSLSPMIVSCNIFFFPLWYIFSGEGMA